MSQQIASSWLDARERLRLAGVGVLSGLVAGLATGIGARIAMRIVALAAHQAPEFTLATIFILILGMLIGMPTGLLFVAVKRYVPSVGLVKGLLFGAFLLLIVGLPILLPPADGELAIGPPLLAKGMFGSLFILYGVILGAVEAWFERSLPAPRRHPASLVGYGLLAILGALGLLIIVTMLISLISQIQLSF